MQMCLGITMETSPQQSNNEMVMEEMGYKKLKQNRSAEKAVEGGSKRRNQREAESIMLKSKIRTWNLSVNRFTTYLRPVPVDDCEN